MRDPLIENYDELRQSRDWTWDQMADEVERVDPRLAAELRAQDAGKARKAAAAPDEDPAKDKPKKTTPPKKRTAPAKPSTAAKK